MYGTGQGVYRLGWRRAGRRPGGGGREKKNRSMDMERFTTKK